MWKSMFAVLAVCLVAQADSPKGDLKKLEGKWALASGEREGNKLSEEELKAASMAITDDEYTVKLGEQTLKGKLKLDPAKKPKAIDATPTDGETLQGIYELKGNEFKVCFAGAGKDRPKDFSSGDFVHVWKRAKK